VKGTRLGVRGTTPSKKTGQPVFVDKLWAQRGKITGRAGREKGLSPWVFQINLDQWGVESWRPSGELLAIYLGETP